MFQSGILVDPDDNETSGCSFWAMSNLTSSLPFSSSFML